MKNIHAKIATFAHLLRRVDFDAIIDHLVWTHIIKSKAEPATTRIKRLLEVLISYSFYLYYIKAKDIILSDFLSRQKHTDIDPHEIISITFNMQKVLHTKYYNINKKEQGKYLVQTRSQAKTSGTLLPKAHSTDKGIDPNVRPEKQVINPIIAP